MVDIHLLAHESEVPFLSIPLADVQRLSIRPFKWLRFVLFAICGTSGELSATPNGKPVDYNSTELSVDATYYFKPSGEFIFIDLDGLNDEVTLSTDSSGCCTDFRKTIMERDGSCVITQEYAEDCDAAHLIPSTKGDEYIQKVFRDRSPLYGPSATISGIDAIENGIFLSKIVHSKFSRGAVTFIKAPNLFAGLDPTDIQGFGPGSTGADTVTIQQLEKPHNYNPDLVETLANSGSLSPSIAFNHGASVDALFQGTPPSAVILDYMYGVATYKFWGSSLGHGVMEKYYNEHYAQIPVPHRPSSDHQSNSSFNDLDNSNKPSSTPPKQRHYRSKMGKTMGNTMDELNLVLMHLQGTTPEEVASRKEKEIEEEEKKAQEASQSKVMDWMKTTDVSGL